MRPCAKPARKGADRIIAASIRWLSLDGKWLAYVSDESGRNEVYVQRFHDASTRRQVSQSGGGLPRWRADGREIFFLSSVRDQVWAVDVGLPGAGAATPGIPHLLFAVSRRLVDYDVTRDGQRVLLAPPLRHKCHRADVASHERGHEPDSGLGRGARCRAPRHRRQVSDDIIAAGARPQQLTGSAIAAFAVSALVLAAIVCTGSSATRSPSGGRSSAFEPQSARGRAI
jgi:WD40-like Beta Propeller Repeat